MKRPSRPTGFTLIEMIVVLLLLGIVGVILSNVIVSSVQNYIFARNSDQMSQKAQLALARIVGELTYATDVTFASADRMVYKARLNRPSCSKEEGCAYALTRTGSRITLEGTDTDAFVTGAQDLIDGVNAANGGNVFLSYFRQDGSTWTTADGFSNANSNENYLAKIKVQIALEFSDAGTLIYRGSINPRANGAPAAPKTE